MRAFEGLFFIVLKKRKFHGLVSGRNLILSVVRIDEYGRNKIYRQRMLIIGIRIFCALKVLNDRLFVLLLLKTKIQEVPRMNDEQKQKIISLRRNGAGYGGIATELGISINTVKSFCRRNSLTAPKMGTACEECGKPITQNPGRKRKRFCSDACRNKWWNSHLDLVKRKANYTYTCPACGKEFTVYGDSHRKFCSHACYIEYRFGGAHHG